MTGTTTKFIQRDHVLTSVFCGLPELNKQTYQLMMTAERGRAADPIFISWAAGE